MRPDEHPELIAMGVGEPTCNHCLTTLFPQAPDSVCDDCALSPTRTAAGTEQFLKDSLRRAEGQSPLDLAAQIALGELQIPELPEDGA